ncbi:TPA: hypothetical protein ACNOH7_001980 [Vibrio fluvialis]
MLAIKQAEAINLLISDFVLPCASDSEVFMSHLIDPNKTVWRLASEAEALEALKHKPVIWNDYGIYIGEDNYDALTITHWSEQDVQTSNRSVS